MKPLEKLLKERARRVHLTQSVMAVCDSHSHNEIMNAVGNVMIKTVVHLYPTGRNATNAWDEIARRIRDSIEQEYEGSTGSRKVHLSKAGDLASVLLSKGRNVDG